YSVSNISFVIDVIDFFFFSSRIRHTRCLSDWSSDVCSSDLLLTDAFLVYGAHLLAGRVNPETLRPEWVSNRRTADIAVVMEAALTSGNIAATLEGLDPPEAGYRRLREALARYRRVAAVGGWPAIP